MNDLVPSKRRIDRPALERIIQRAAELQTRDREIGEGLTEEEVLQLGEEVGILPLHLRRALQEEQTRALVAADREHLLWLVGPRRVAAERTIQGDADQLDTNLSRWMTEGELLQVKRRYPDRTSWERKEGAWASLRRSFGGVGGRKYLLARAREVVSRVASIGEGQSHVQLVADLSNTRREHLLGGSLLMGGGAAITGVAVVLGVMIPVALIPLAVSAPAGFAVARNRRQQLEKFQVALEQILDRLQHGELDELTKPPRLGPGVVERIADEIRKVTDMPGSRTHRRD